MNTPEDFKGNPAMGHNSKRKRLFSEVGVSRKSAKASLELEPPSESADARLPKTTGNIGNTPSDIFALTHADDDVFSGNIVAGMTSIGYQQTCHKNQLPMGSSSFYVAPVMYQYPIPPFENELYHAAASDSYLSYDNDIVTEGHFNLRVPPLPQTLSADPRRHNSFECPTDISTQPLVPWPASENLPPSPENTATQPLATSNTDIPSAFGNFSQAPDESCTFTSNTNYTSPPRNTCPQTPPHRIKTPSLSSTFSTIESQRQGPVTPYDPMNTPSRRTTPPPEAPIIHESEEYFSFGDMLKGAGDDEEQFESWDDFQRRDKSKNSAHSQTSVWIDVNEGEQGPDVLVNDE
jgi:hypothetical protein